MTRSFRTLKNWPWWQLLLLLLLVSAPIALQPAKITHYQEARYSDLLISHLPSAIFLQKALSTWGEIPLWNPTILSGAPFAADPLSGMAYLPNWIAAVFPVPLSFNLLNLLHLLLAALGCYLLGRRLGHSRSAGLLFGIAFAGTPKLFAHLGLGHFSLVNAVSWTPWVLLSIEKSLAGLNAGRIRPVVIMGFVLGLIFLIDPRWALPAAVIGAAFALHRWWSIRLQTDWRLALRYGALAAGMAVGTASLLAIPMYEFLQLSTRASLTSSARTIQALDWGHLLGYFHPLLAQPEQVGYLGVGVLILAVLGLGSRKPSSTFWGLAFVLSVLYSLGESTPVYGIVSALLPTAGYLRVPARFLFLAAIAMAALAGFGLDRLLQPRVEARGSRSLRPTYLGMAIFTLLLNVGLVIIGIRSANDILLPAGMVLVIVTLIESRLSQRLPARIAASFLVLAVALELSFVSWSMIRMDPLAERDGGGVVPSYGLERIFSPSNSIPALNAAREALEKADGVNPLHLAAYAEYLERATGFQGREYGVALPPYPEGDPEKPWAIQIDGQLFRRLNVTRVVSKYPLEDPSLKLIQQAGGEYTYTFEEALPRAWVVGKADGEITPAEITSWSPNQIEVEARGPGLLVLSELSYPGWRAQVGDRQLPLLNTEQPFRAVELHASEQHVVFSFRPLSVQLGVLLFSLTLICGLGLAWKR